MRNRPSNSDDIIDSREVIEAIEELESEREALSDAFDEATEAAQEERDRKRPRRAILKALEAAEDEARSALATWDESEEAEELKQLKKLESQAEGYASDWRHGTQLIRDSHFEDYAQELAEEIGAIDRNASWPNNCIDWERAASELQQDYTSVDFGGVTYWVR